MPGNPGLQSGLPGATIGEAMSAMTNESSVVIDRPIAEVFDYTVHQVPEWSFVVMKNEPLISKPGVVGSTFRVTTEDRGQQMQFDGVVMSHTPPTGHTVVMKGKQFDMAVEYRFEDLGGQTRVTQRSVVQAKGFLKLFFTLFGRLMNKASCEAQARELASLKAKAEALPTN